MASMAVIWARISEDVKITSIGMLLILFPASTASSTPFSVKGTSTQPVKRFFSFHSDSPCLIRIKAASSEHTHTTPVFLWNRFTHQQHEQQYVWRIITGFLPRFAGVLDRIGHRELRAWGLNYYAEASRVRDFARSLFEIEALSGQSQGEDFTLLLNVWALELTNGLTQCCWSHSWKILPKA